jgi:hypothetical protein
VVSVPAVVIVPAVHTAPWGAMLVRVALVVPVEMDVRVNAPKLSANRPSGHPRAARADGARYSDFFASAAFES